MASRRGRFEIEGHRVTGDRQAGRSRSVGWEYVHVCFDDASQTACSQSMTDEKADSAIAALKSAVALHKRLAVTVSRVMTDNGACYKAQDLGKACSDPGLRHILAKPYKPKTNGKAERINPTASREWAYANGLPQLRPPAPPSCPSGCIDTTDIDHTGRYHHGLVGRLRQDQDNLLRLHA